MLARERGLPCGGGGFLILCVFFVCVVGRARIGRTPDDGGGNMYAENLIIIIIKKLELGSEGKEWNRG